MEWVSQIDLSSLTEAIEAIVPVALPSVVAISSIRKAIGFLFSMIAGA